MITTATGTIPSVATPPEPLAPDINQLGGSSRAAAAVDDTQANAKLGVTASLDSAKGSSASAAAVVSSPPLISPIDTLTHDRMLGVAPGLSAAVEQSTNADRPLIIARITIADRLSAQGLFSARALTALAGSDNGATAGISHDYVHPGADGLVSGCTADALA